MSLIIIKKTVKCCHGNATMSYVCIAELHVTVNNTNLLVFPQKCNNEFNVYCWATSLSIIKKTAEYAWKCKSAPSSVLMNDSVVANNHLKCLIFCLISTKSAFSWQILKKVLNTIFMKICPVVSKMIHVGRRMDQWTQN